MLYLIIALSSFSFSLLLTIFAIKLFSKYHILDVPNARSNHKSATLRGGGIAIVITLLVAMFIHQKILLKEIGILYLFISLSIIAAISFIDDLKSTSIIIRVIFQVMAISILLISYFSNLNIYITSALILGLFIFINFYNFMDGIDGSAAAEAIHISSSIIILSFLTTIPYEVMIIALITASASLGFIIYNWHPAKIFLGDVGSISLGFVCGWMLLAIAFHGQLAAAIILPLFYISDSGITIIKRLFAGKKIWKAHSEHFYQQAVRKGIPHNIITKKIIYCNSSLCILGITSAFYPIPAVILAVIVTVATLYNLQKSGKVH
jgi:UDP-N-acetylmuramyl pentapeptide phosphotransferase/UDP-N-acetylglucosamine-1-phosphate transferase